MEILVQNLGSVQIDFIKLLFEDEFPKLLSIINCTATQIEDCAGLNTSVRYKDMWHVYSLKLLKAYTQVKPFYIFRELSTR